MKPQASQEFAAFVGLDWADAKHDACLQAAGAERRELLILEHRPDAIDAWVQTLRMRFNGHPVAVCLELNKGPMMIASQHVTPGWPDSPTGHHVPLATRTSGTGR